jgi:hypothetical protein
MGASFVASSSLGRLAGGRRGTLGSSVKGKRLSGASAVSTAFGEALLVALPERLAREQLRRRYRASTATAAGRSPRA